MLVFGIDVVCMAMFALGLVITSIVVACRIPLTKEQGDAAVMATIITAVSMVIFYMMMTKVLDAIIGVYW